MTQNSKIFYILKGSTYSQLHLRAKSCTFFSACLSSTAEHLCFPKTKAEPAGIYSTITFVRSLWICSIENLFGRCCRLEYVNCEASVSLDLMASRGKTNPDDFTVSPRVVVSCRRTQGALHHSPHKHRGSSLPPDNLGLGSQSHDREHCCSPWSLTQTQHVVRCSFPWLPVASS